MAGYCRVAISLVRGPEAITSQIIKYQTIILHVLEYIRLVFISVLIAFFF